MSLTSNDLQQIRTIMADEIGNGISTTVRPIVEEAIQPLRDEIKALRNDIKEIYDMIAELQSSTVTDKDFKKRTLEEKLLTLNAELISVAKQAGISLPRP